MSQVEICPQDVLSQGPILIHFLVRVIVDLLRTHSDVKTVGLVNFNTPNLCYIPTELMKQISDVTFLNFNINTNSTKKARIQYASIVVHTFVINKQVSMDHKKLLRGSIVKSEVLSMLEYFKVVGNELKVIVVVDEYEIKSTELYLLAHTYNRLGVIDIIYVMMKENRLFVLRFNDIATEFVVLSDSAKIEHLFPSRLSNLSGRPYKVACSENPPMCYRESKTNRTSGIDVEFIDIIAKHQRTVAEYKYTPKSIHPSNLWQSTDIDFATYRITIEPKKYNFAMLFFPTSYRWCLAVPKTYNRVLHAQILWPFTVDLWVLIVALVICYLLYSLFLKRALQRRHPNAYPIVNTPLHILRIFLVFLLSEYYTALLSSNLGLSKIPAYPRTIEQFEQSTIPLIAENAESLFFIDNNPQILSRTIQWNFSQRYDPTRLAVIQLCDLFRYYIGSTTKRLGKELSHHHYHLIDEPIRYSMCMSPFRKTSPLLARFQMYVNRLNEAGIWDFIVRKWVRIATNASKTDPMDNSMLKLEHFVPVYIVGGYLYLLSIVVFLLEIISHKLISFV